MKIGILTLGLKDNYGGILQAIALFSFLKKNGFQPILIRKYPIEKPIKIAIKSILKVIPYQNIKGIRISNLKYKQNFTFWSNYIDNQTPIFFKKMQIENYINHNELSAIIVGSDQVWRYKYINDSEYDTYFLNFELKKQIKKISYAASFGISEWECSSVSRDVSALLRDFDFISVREKSGVKILSKEFNIRSVYEVLDPTLLIGSDFFKSMIKSNFEKKYDCVTYILDKNNKKQEIINLLNIKFDNKFNKELLTDKSVLTIPQWLANFNNTKMVITDSFHGMVFSILFEKEFFVIINKERGSDRFISLCEKLNILDRLIDSEIVDFSSIEYKPLNYVEIKNNLSGLRELSSDFLLKALSDE